MSDRSFQTDRTGGMQAKSGVGAGGAQRGKRGGVEGDSAEDAKSGKQRKRVRGLPESIRQIVEEAKARYGSVFERLAQR